MAQQDDDETRVRVEFVTAAEVCCATCGARAPTSEEAQSAVLPFMVASCPNELGQPQRVTARFEDIDDAMLFKSLDLVLEAGSVHALRFTADLIDGLVDGELKCGTRSPGHAQQIRSVCAAMRALANHVDSAAPPSKKDLH
jgi:hypothetical protein